MTSKELAVIELTEENIESMVYQIRGQKVMLDFDLARIYGHTTKRLNEQAKRNIDKFPEDFMFRLTEEELRNLVKCQFGTSRKSRTESEEISRSQIVTTKKSAIESEQNERSQIATPELWATGRGGRSYLPCAFTEQGIYMLMTVLKGELATKQSKALIRLFKRMKDYIVESNNLLTSRDILELTNQVYQNTKGIELLKRNDASINKKLTKVMDNFIDPSKYKHFLILDGQKIEGDAVYQQIYSLAKHSIYIIDDYIDIKTLRLLKVCPSNLEVIIFSDNKATNSLSKTFVNEFIEETNIKLSFIIVVIL